MWRVNILILTWGVLSFLITASSGENTQPLKPDEYVVIALIYDDELSALGRRALFPICVTMPPGEAEGPVLRYLQGHDFAVSDPTLCEPAVAPGGRHPKDYPHGLRISVGELERDQGGINIRVEADDLTLRPGEHFAAMLRKGIYHLKLDAKQQWQIAGYTKEYDSADDKHENCSP